MITHIINLFEELKEKLDLTYMFISHDLNVVRHILDRITVMYLGKIVEVAETEELFKNLIHLYTKALLSAVPVANPRYKNKRIMLYGDVSSPINTKEGCVFESRCSYCMDICKNTTSELINTGNEHYIACHLVNK